MFVVVTVFAVWLGWELKFIRDRKALRNWLAANGGGVTVQNPKGFDGDYYHEVVAIPFWRSWMGDEPIAYFDAPPLSRAEIERLTKAFPESYGLRSAPGAVKVTPIP